MMLASGFLALALSVVRVLAVQQVFTLQEQTFLVIHKPCDTSLANGDEFGGTFKPCKTPAGVFTGCLTSDDVCLKKSNHFAQCRPITHTLPTWNSIEVVKCAGGLTDEIKPTNKRKLRAGDHDHSHAHTSPSSDGDTRRNHGRKSRGDSSRVRTIGKSKSHTHKKHESKKHLGRKADNRSKTKKGRKNSSSSSAHTKGSAKGNVKKVPHKVHDHSKDHGMKKGHDHKKDHAEGEGENCPKADMAKGCECAGKLWRCADKHDPIAKSCDVGLKCVRKNRFYAICATPEREAALAGNPEWEGVHLPCGVDVATFEP